MNSPTVLITGASGFIGGHLVTEALKRDTHVFAAVRATSSKKYLTDPRIKFAQFDLSSTLQITAAIDKITHEPGPIDYVIHNAGLTKSVTEEGYFNANTYNTKNIISVLTDSGIRLKKFILVSSLAAYGPGNPVSFEPVKNEHQPEPVTSYGRSKLLAEQVVMRQSKSPWAIIRPTVVYGPGEKEIFAIFNLINRHIHPVLVNKNQLLSFIYVKDLARAIMDVTLSGHTGKSYFVSDGNAYKSNAFGEHVKTCLGKRTLKVNITGKMLNLIAHTLERLYSPSKKFPGLNVAKAKEMNSLNWLCDTTPLYTDTGFLPQHNLEQGIKETVEWYKREKWL